MLQGAVLALMIASKTNNPLHHAPPIRMTEIHAQKLIHRESARTLHDRVEKEQKRTYSQKNKRNPITAATLSYQNEAMGLSLRYPNELTAHSTMEKMQNANATVVVRFDKSKDDLNGGTYDPPVTRLIRDIEVVNASYATYLDSVTLTVRNLDTAKDAPTLDELTENYTDLLNLFNPQQTTVCNCDKNVGGQPTKLAYSYIDDNVLLVQTWTIVDKKVYIFSMITSTDAYETNYANFQSIIGSLKVQ